MANQKAFFVDISTTENVNRCPIEFSYCIVDFDDFIINQNLKEKIETIQIIPDEDITLNGTFSTNLIYSKINKINYTGIDLNTALKQIYALLKNAIDEKMYIVGFCHGKFDLAILNETFKRVLNYEMLDYDLNYYIDIQALAKKCITDDLSLKFSRSCIFLKLMFDNYAGQKARLSILNNLRQSIGSKNELYISMLILKMLCKKNLFSDFSKIATALNTITTVTVMPIGKYKGMKIADIQKKDFEYLVWMFNNIPDLQIKNSDLYATLNSIVNIS